MEWKDVDNDGVIRIGCLGDSITEGGKNNNWPLFLQEYLNFLSTVDGNTYEVKNFGKAGAAVRHYLENCDGNGDGVINEGGEYFLYDSPAYTSSLKYNPDIMIVQFGANDGLPGNAAILDEYFKADYTDYLIKPYLEKGAKVILATPTFASNGLVDPFVNGEISEIIRGIAKELNLDLIEMNKATQFRRESFPDGIHGNASGYSIIAQKYYNEIFGGKLITVKFKTKAGALITFGQHMAVADENGECFVTVIDENAPRSFDVKVFCADFKTVTETVTINGDTTLTYDLIPGSYNIARGVKVISDCHLGDNVAQNAVDGDKDTRWESEYHDNTWIMADLGEAKKINGVNIVWEGAYSAHYTVEASLDGENFTQIADVNIDKAGLEATVFPETRARFVKINCLVRFGVWGSSIIDLQILSDYRD